MIDLTTTNVLLGILAAVAVLQMTAMIVAAVAAARVYRRALERVEGVERTLAPVVARAQAMMDHLERVSARVDAGTERLDTALTATTRSAEIALGVVNGKVRRTAALVAAIASGGRAALRAWRGGGRRSPAPVHPFSSSSLNVNLQQSEEHHASI